MDSGEVVGGGDPTESIDGTLLSALGVPCVA
jgi:hypothetical protein